MTGLPHWVSTRAYDAAWGGEYRPEPPLHAATPEDVANLAAVREASARFLIELTRHPWKFDSTETVSWRDHVAEHRAIDAAIEAALVQAQRSMEAAL